jgi:hypothetical protein
MATLNPSNITNGNTIEAEDVLQLYRAFGTGSGDPITGVVISGSLNGNATSATSATTATSASAITTIPTGSGTYYLTFVSSQNAGTYNVRTDGDLSYDASNNTLNVTSSFSQTSSISISSSISQTSSFALKTAQSWTSPISNIPATPYTIDILTPNFVIVNTNNVVGFNFNQGYEGQIIEFINDPSLIYITSSNIALTASLTSIYGYSGYSLNPGGNEILGTFLDNGGGSGSFSQFYSFKMQYRDNNWYFLYFNPSA